MKAGNFFAALPENGADEVIQTLLQSDQVRIERIVSHGQITPEGEWYDQAQDEWVIVLQGAARLKMHDQEGEISLNKGDYLHIPAHCKHRVSWTDPEQKTLWLALFFTP